MRYIQQDWQGSVRTVTNANGFVVSRTDHQAFGGEVGYGTGQRSIDQGYNRDAATRQAYGLTERDDASGLDHTWFRKNENLAGRWTSPDPYKGSMNLTDPQSFNRYSYVQNQPTNFVDPSGLVASSPDWLGASFDLWMAGCSDLSGENRTIIVCWTQNPWNTPEPGQGPGGGGGGGGKDTPYPKGPDAKNCSKIAEFIKAVRDELARRGSDLILDLKNLLPGPGPMTIAGHADKFRERQGVLRKALNAYNELGCGNGPGPMIPADAWKWATSPTPNNSWRRLPTNGNKMVEIAGGVVVTAATAYVIYRVIRLLPSLAPPLWPSIPANLAIP